MSDKCTGNEIAYIKPGALRRAACPSVSINLLLQLHKFVDGAISVSARALFGPHPVCFVGLLGSAAGALWARPYLNKYVMAVMNSVYEVEMHPDGALPKQVHIGRTRIQLCVEIGSVTHLARTLRAGAAGGARVAGGVINEARAAAAVGLLCFL
ncbi:hypothetical protein EVAR_22801_1 [Eumeta japonica]|uniref:Uncharacterized protein n=1 Tax=Eumeta variegata TaxID=151549 RepID=A0A4C1VEP8_EUMVA|nr:hypothetical protein EVAR_22801_1 [Eumeta japonica]